MHVDDAPAPASAQDDWQNVPRILIGATKILDHSQQAEGDHYLDKPFQYGELIRTIERLLADAEA
jgi:hypothetical protein